MANQGPYSMGGATWPGISKLVEEAGEVCQVAGKLLGTGGAVEHWDGSNLRERLQEEIADLMAACQFVIDANGLDAGVVRARAALKLEIFNQWHRAGT